MTSKESNCICGETVLLISCLVTKVSKISIDEIVLS